jgi:hypothetical protein
MPMRCRQCLGEDFDLQDGLYFCAECGIQVENLVEMEYEEFNENLQSQKKVKVGDDKKRQKEALKGEWKLEEVGQEIDLLGCSSTAD